MLRDIPYRLATNDIARAVDAAIDAAMSPEDFLREAAECWRQKLAEDSSHAVKVFLAKPALVAVLLLLATAVRAQPFAPTDNIIAPLTATTDAKGGDATDPSTAATRLVDASVEVTGGQGGDSAALPAPTPDDEDADSLLIASMWCVVSSHEGAATEGDGDSPAACDGGLGVGLARRTWHGLIPAAVIGTHSLGAGLAYVLHHTPKRTIAIGVLGIVEWSNSEGIDDRVRPALAATFSFGGPAQ